MLGSVSEHRSFDWGNNLSLHIHSFGENQGKCNQTCEPTNGVFSSVPTRQDLHIADRSYLPWIEAYGHSLSLSYLLLMMPCLEGKPDERHFFAEFFINRWFFSLKKVSTLCLAVCMQITVRFVSLIRTPSRFRLSRISRFWGQCCFPSYFSSFESE